MKYGFVLDQTRCIGCHACTVACKSENNVSVGAFRTWVKYIEKGEFPDTRRFFGVLRCNHCEDAPCVSICPTRALYKRDDGIVDFDNSRCIGCKSCMQACPYDALYIDPLDQTAAKCNYCSHRVDVGLEPACVIVCPTQAIVSGDLDDPESKISKVVASGDVAVRKPEKHTRPQVLYKGADPTVLDPDMDIQDHSSMMTGPTREQADSLSPVRITYQAGHSRPWGFKIALYLWTKSIAAGALLAPALFSNLLDYSSQVAAPLIALVFIMITGVLLVIDLKRPDRFWYIFTKPNYDSWLVLGSYVILFYVAAALMWLYFGWFGPEEALGGMRIGAAGTAVFAAGYSAFLFHQARGRDLWLGKMLFWNLVSAALLAGCAVMVLSNFVRDEGCERWFFLLAIASVINSALIVVDLLTHKSAQISKAMPYLLAPGFYAGVFGAGFVLPVALFALAWHVVYHPLMAAVAACATLASLLVHEVYWIKAGQIVPLS